jgi:group II intron reverse transcriptase/maturase
MPTGLERIAVKAREEPKLRFTSLAHHVTKQLIWKSLCQIPNKSAAGCDGKTVAEAKEEFEEWVEPMLQSMHRKGYRPPPIRRVYIPKPGKKEKRPLGVPCVTDRALQRSVAQVLSGIYEQDFESSSFGGRPGLGAHHALATLNEVIAGRKVSWVLEADLKNFFGSLDHGWLLRFVEHRVGDPRIISLIRRWLKAGVLEDGTLHPNEEGTPQGGSISVLLSNVYLHYVLDLWFEHVVKPRLSGEAYLVRYIDDFVICFQYRADALRVQTVLRKRLEKFRLALEPNKTKLAEFGRFAQRDASKRGRTRPETIYFLGFTLYCTRNRNGNFKVGMRTEKSRIRRSLAHLRDLMRRMRHLPVREQVINLNRVLRGHYAYYGIAGNLRALQRVHRAVERYWRKMLSSRSRAGNISWEVFYRIKERFPLQRPKLRLPYRELQRYAVL